MQSNDDTHNGKSDTQDPAVLANLKASIIEYMAYTNTKTHLLSTRCTSRNAGANTQHPLPQDAPKNVGKYTSLITNHYNIQIQSLVDDILQLNKAPHRKNRLR